MGEGGAGQQPAAGYPCWACGWEGESEYCTPPAAGCMRGWEGIKGEVAPCARPWHVSLVATLNEMCCQVALVTLVARVPASSSTHARSTMPRTCVLHNQGQHVHMHCCCIPLVSKTCMPLTAGASMQLRCNMAYPEICRVRCTAHSLRRGSGLAKHCVPHASVVCAVHSTGNSAAHPSACTCQLSIRAEL